MQMTNNVQTTKYATQSRPTQLQQIPQPPDKPRTTSRIINHTDEILAIYASTGRKSKRTSTDETSLHDAQCTSYYLQKEYNMWVTQYTSESDDSDSSDDAYQRRGEIKAVSHLDLSLIHI